VSTVRTEVRPAHRPADAGTPLPVTLAVRLIGAALLLASGGIHLYLWQNGYADISVIGPSFMADVVLSGLAALAVLAAPPRWLPWICALAGLFELGSLGALLLSLTVGLFGFFEAWSAQLVVQTIVVEAAGFVVLFGFALQQLVASRHRGTRVGG
jgi:hypothetical protein